VLIDLCIQHGVSVFCFIQCRACIYFVI
jgi:hypothetical protein